MLHIYYGRENCDKGKFIFDNADKSAIVLVPDQFTLEAEREAIRCLDADGIMDLEILSISRLGFRMLSEVGGTKKNRIDIYGRHILLTSVIDDLAEKGELTAYSKLAGKSSFVELVNNFISGMKQHGVMPETLSEIRDDMKSSEILARKLDDMVKIFEEYENRISGRFADTEDYLSLYVDAASKSQLVKGKEIWVWGFDSFSPKNAELITELIKTANVNIVLTAGYGGRDSDLFALTRNIIKKFKETAELHGIAFECTEIAAEKRNNLKADNSDYYAQRCICAEILERELFAIPIHPAASMSGEAGDDGRYKAALTLVAAANYYSEAETAAAYVKKLVRDKGLKYRDIFIACNDLSGRSEIIKRVFAEYGMEIFTDENRTILTEPLVIYILSLISIMANGYRTQDIMSFLKTGLSPIKKEKTDELENYALKYRIRGTAWKKPFKYGRLEYGEAAFEKIEDTRQQLMLYLAEFEEAFKASRQAESRVKALYTFLSGDKQLCKKAADRDMTQIWEAVMHVLDQVVNVIGDKSVSMETFYELLKAGFEAVTVGSIPPAADGLVLGTLQRTRTGKVKALVVIGANDGVLPKEKPDDELLSEDEKEMLAGAGFEICALDKVRVQEERLAIYRAFSRPEEYIYISYSGSGISGDEEKPSRIFNTIKKIFPQIPVLRDAEGRHKIAELAASKNGAMEHLIKDVRSSADGSDLNETLEEWSDVILWYKEHDPSALKKAAEGLFYKNRSEQLESKAVAELYAKRDDELTVSPSRLEKYSRCPFSHFVSYGLRPEERRMFEAGSREIGDVYHECLMIFSKELTRADESGTMRWNTVSKDESDALIAAIIENEAASYKEGLMVSGSEEAYRKSRMNDTLKEAAWALVCQAREGDIRNMFFEEGFGKSDDRAFPAIEVKTSNGTAYIEGKIDRVDILGNGAVKVIDYKSGNEKWNTQEARSGWRLQLMLYLKAAEMGIKSNVSTEECENISGIAREPAGIFYFVIKDADLNGAGMSSEEIKKSVSEGIQKEFRMNGLAVDSFGNIENIEKSMDRYSKVVVNLQKSKVKPEKGATAENAEYKYTGAVMTRDEFAELQRAFDGKINELVDSLLAGEVAAKPKRLKDMSACTYCSYKSICRFDISLPGCTYEKI